MDKSIGAFALPEMTFGSTIFRFEPLLRRATVATVEFKGEVEFLVFDLEFLRREFARELGVGEERGESVEGRLNRAVALPDDFGRYASLSHLPEQVTLLVDCHERPTVDLLAYLLNAFANVGALCEFTSIDASRCRFDVRLHAQIRGLLV